MCVQEQSSPMTTKTKPHMASKVEGTRNFDKLTAVYFFRFSRLMPQSSFISIYACVCDVASLLQEAPEQERVIQHHLALCTQTCKCD